MRHGRWLVVIFGVAVAVPLAVGPAGAVTRAVTSGDQAVLSAGVITATDVPATWTAQKAGASSTKTYQGIADCKQIAAASTIARKGPHKQSPQFSDPSDQGNTYAANSVYAFKSSAAASKYLAPYQASTAPTCIQKGLQKQLGSLDQVSAGQPVSNLQGVGDAAVGYEFQVQANVQGATMTFVFDVIGVRIGRAFIGFTFVNPNVQIPQGPSIVNAVISRVQHAAGG
jgi:hypothetical protein